MKTLNLIPALLFISLMGCSDLQNTDSKIKGPVTAATIKELNKKTDNFILPIDRLYPDFNTLNRKYLRKEDGC